MNYIAYRESLRAHIIYRLKPFQTQF